MEYVKRTILPQISRSSHIALREPHIPHESSRHVAHRAPPSTSNGTGVVVVPFFEQPCRVSRRNLLDDIPRFHFVTTTRFISYYLCQDDRHSADIEVR